MFAELFSAIGLLALTVSMVNGLPGTWPIENGSWRPTPLHFGMHVTPDPDENPIDPPERFVGYHVATDFEIFPSEENEAVDVYAVCTGTGAYSAFAGGYGGLITQHCTLDGEQVTMLYGHLAVASLPAPGTLLHKGDKIAELGAARSHDTDGNRKHLHFGIIKGWSSEIRGYVDTPEETNLFIDPQSVLPL